MIDDTTQIIDYGKYVVERQILVRDTKRTVVECDHNEPHGAHKWQIPGGGSNHGVAQLYCRGKQ